MKLSQDGTQFLGPKCLWHFLVPPPPPSSKSFIFCFQDKQLKNWTLIDVCLILTASFHLTLSPLFHLGVQIHHHNQLHRAIMWADALDAWGNTGHSMLARDWSRSAESAIWLVGGTTGYMVGCSGWWLPGYCHNHCPLWPPSMEEMGRKGELSLFRREEHYNWNWMRVSFRNGRYTQTKMILGMKSLLCHESYTAIEPCIAWDVSMSWSRW